MVTRAADVLLSFQALYRFYIAINPQHAETRWGSFLEFEALPPAKRLPGHWYRFESGSGFIHVDHQLNGEWKRELPASIDPAEVVVVPRLESITTLFDTLREIASRGSRSEREEIKPTFDNLVFLTLPEHNAAAVKDLGLPAYAALLAGVDLLLKYLKQCVDKSETDLRNGKTTGSEVGALILISELAKSASQADGSHIESQASTLQRLYGRMLAPGAISLEQMAFLFVQDCIDLGFETQVLSVLDKLRRDGREKLSFIRENVIKIMQLPGFELVNYYEGLFLLAPCVRATMIGYEAVDRSPRSSAVAHQRAEVEANVAEERLVRMGDALFFAARDRNGSETAAVLAEIRALRKANRANDANARVSELIDLKMFYPRPFRSFLLG